MNQLITTPVHTSGSVDDYFLVEGQVLSTRTADAYKAMDRASKESVSLWKLRAKLGVNSEEVRQFLNRLSVIGEFDPPLCSMMTYGVDASGVGFAVFPALLGRSFSERSPDKLENERTFGSAVRKIEALHAQEIYCGDICGNSFWVDRVGEVSFIGTLGSFEAKVTSPSMLPPIETLHFVAPEQHQGGLLTPAADVFALGVIGYFLLTGHYPFGDEPPLPGSTIEISTIKAPSSYGSQVPAWADEVLFNCLQPDPSHRYKDAGELSKAISESRQKTNEQQEKANSNRMSGIASSLGQAAPASSLYAPITVPGKTATTKLREEETSKPKKSNRMAFVLAGLLSVAIAIGLVITRPAPEAPTNKLLRDLPQYGNAIDDPKLRDGLSDIANPQTPLASKQTKYDQIAASDDPLSHELLVKIAKDAPTPEEREMAEKALLSRATRLGLKRSAEQVRQWLRANRKGENPDGYVAVLRSLDPTMPDADHYNILKQAYPSNPKIVLRLVAALAFDTNKVKEYQPLLSQLIMDMTHDDTADRYSVPALVLASAELAPIFTDDALQSKDLLTNEDLIWVLKIAADRGDISVRSIATMAAERGVFSPLRRVFIDLVTSRDNLPQELVQVLIKAAAGALKKEDVSVVGRWLDSKSEKLLFAICADDTDPATALEAFDILAGKSLTVESAQVILAWIRRDHWSERAKFIQALGTLGCFESVSEAQQAKVVDAFAAYLDDQQILEALIEIKSPVIVRALMTKYGHLINMGMLLQLMSFPDKEVRMMAIKRVSPSHDIVVSKMAIDGYAKETDPDVKKLYEESFWFIKQKVENAKQ